jgi:periplasmic divalent cation tolerance protein
MYIKAIISATSKNEADRISDKLTQKGLVAGTMITKGDSRYHWESDTVEEKYFNISCYTLESKKESIIEHVEDLHSDNVPIIEFTDIDGNQDFLDWIEENIATKG